MLYRYAKLAMALLLVGLLAGTVLGQRFPFGGGFGGAAMLLGNPDVQQELKLSEDQIAKAKEVGQQVRDKFKDAFAGLKDTPKDQIREKAEEIMKQVNTETEKGLKGVLNADQTKRLKQLELQAKGPAAFTDPDVEKTLALTADQKDKIKTITQDANTERGEIFKNAKGDFQAAMTKMQTLQKETLEKTTATLNDTQKKTWKDMTGNPFEFKFRRPGATQ
jgi:Spy/CpxP family protein refolding chaperone